MTIRLGILASTNATDMEAIVQAIQSKKLDATIVVIITNKDCGAVVRAKKHHLPFFVLRPKKDQPKEAYDKQVAKLLEQNKVDLILMIGWMRIVSPWFVQHFKNKIMNIHPSLLPAFAGGMDINVHKETLKRGCKLTGATLMFIDEGADTGPIIAQKAVFVAQHDTPESLKAKVQKIEQELLVEGVRAFAERRIIIKGTQVEVK